MELQRQLKLRMVRVIFDFTSSSNVFLKIFLGRIPLWFAAAENNLKVVTYLITQEHDAYKLLEDRRVSKKKLSNYIFAIFSWKWKYTFWIYFSLNKTENSDWLTTQLGSQLLANQNFLLYLAKHNFRNCIFIFTKIVSFFPLVCLQLNGLRQKVK